MSTSTINTDTKLGCDPFEIKYCLYTVVINFGYIYIQILAILMCLSTKAVHKWHFGQPMVSGLFKNWASGTRMFSPFVKYYECY